MSANNNRSLRTNSKAITETSEESLSSVINSRPTGMIRRKENDVHGLAQSSPGHSGLPVLVADWISTERSQVTYAPPLMLRAKTAAQYAGIGCPISPGRP